MIQLSCNVSFVLSYVLDKYSLDDKALVCLGESCDRASCGDRTVIW